jgi:hypothetical protein
VRPIARYRTTLESSLPREVVFAELADFSTTERWDPGVVSARRLDEGPLRIGSTFHVVSRFAGRNVPLDYEIVQFDEPNAVTLRTETGTLVGVDTMIFRTTATGTVITYDADLRLKGALRILDPLLMVAFRRIGDRARSGLLRALQPA